MRERQEGAAQRDDEASCPSSESQKTEGSGRGGCDPGLED